MNIDILVEQCADRGIGGVLNFFSVVYGSVMVRGVLSFLGGAVVKLGVQIGGVVFRCEATGMLVLVPLEVDPRVQGAFLVDCYVAVLFDGVEQVIGVALSYVLDAKIVNYKGEHNWPPLVAPQARGDWSLILLVLVEALFQERFG